MDNFECTYFYVNDPYFQSKSKNKNPFYNQGKRFYRRYIVEEWDDKANEDKKTEDIADNQDNHLVNKSNDVDSFNQ